MTVGQESPQPGRVFRLHALSDRDSYRELLRFGHRGRLRGIITGFLEAL